MATRVVHVRDGFDVYIGRACRGFRQGSKWGNPYRIGRDGSREEVIEKYRAYLQRRPDLLSRLPELRGKRLGCFCAPLSCHGNVLAALADALPERNEQ